MLQRCLLLLCLSLCAACGTTIRNNVTNAPDAPLAYRQFTYTAVAVNSTSQTDDAKRYNTELKAEAQQALLQMVKAKNAQWVKAPAKVPTLVVTINANYGNRGIRLIPPIFRGRAGQALIVVDIQMRSADGHVLYATHTEGKLRRGLFGGDSLNVAKRTVRDAFDDFAKRF
jgi:hypothetical protein